MRRDTVRKLVVAVVAVTLVGALGTWLLPFVDAGYARLFFAGAVAVLVPALVVPELLGVLRDDDRYTRVGAVLVVALAASIALLQSVAPADALLSAYAVVAAVAVAVVATYLTVAYDVDRALLRAIE